MPILGVNALKERVEIHEPARTVSDIGQPEVAWTSWGERWGRVQKLTGQDLYFAAASGSRAQWEVRIRYDENVDEGWRIVFGSRTFEVESVVDVDDARTELLLLCWEHPA